MLHGLQKYNERIQDSKGIIPADEPVFLLRAQDKIAAQVVRYWAYLHEKNGGDSAHVAAVKEHAAKMDAWPIKKIADI